MTIIDIGRVGRDEGGYALVAMALLLPVTIGIVGLSLDLGRYAALQTELQNIVDAAALRGAKELDGGANSIGNATSAINAFVQEQPRMTTGGALTVQVDSFVFFRGDNCETVTTDSALAACVQVSAIPRSASVYFGRLIGAESAMNSRAIAKAEARSVACEVQPLMLCNPWGSSDFESHVSAGQMIRLKPKSGASNLIPGDFGLLDPPGAGNTGGPQQALNLASSAPPFCYANTLSVKTGGTNGPIMDGLNTRFDIYPNAANSPLLSYKPAMNVVKGYVYPGCPPNNATQNGEQLPRDSCLPPVGSAAATVGTCSTSTSNLEIGDGVWNSPLDANGKSPADRYWEAHHNGTKPANLGASGGMTRFQLYKKETGCDENDVCTGVPETGFEWKSGTENAAPMCRPPGDPSLLRRLIHTALVDCSAQTQQVTGQGTNTTVRGNKLARFFLTELSPNGEIFAEFVDVIQKDDDLHDKIHLLVRLVPVE